tara:strand:+ start:478 stop:1713 length:1236 start_codon:yes stop_codon:yes gene_type:complete
MLKLFIVFLFLTLSQSTFADWLDIVKDGLESTIEVSQDTWDIAKKTFDDESVSEEVIPIVQENIEISRSRALAVWDDLVDVFDEIIILKSEKNDASSISLFGKSKKDYDEKIELIFQSVASLINDPELENNRKTLQILKNKILKSQEKSSNVYAKSVLASGKERKELENLADDYKKDSQEYKDSKVDLIRGVRSRLALYGLDLNKNQVEVLLSRVDAGDIIGMTTSFSVIAELTEQFSDATIASGENLQIAKKYYGMHVILLELQMHIQKNYINRLRNVYLVRANDIRSENKLLIDETFKLIDDAEGTYLKIYKNNLESQKYTLKVLGLYEEILRKDLLKIETGLKKVNDNYLVSLNTFQTVTVAADLASLMAENSNLFNEVMSIQVPELIPFENLQMQKEFEALTLQLSN